MAPRRPDNGRRVEHSREHGAGPVARERCRRTGARTSPREQAGHVQRATRRPGGPAAEPVVGAEDDGSVLGMQEEGLLDGGDVGDRRRGDARAGRGLEVTRWGVAHRPGTVARVPPDVLGAERRIAERRQEVEQRHARRACSRATGDGVVEVEALCQVERASRGLQPGWAGEGAIRCERREGRVLGEGRVAERESVEIGQAHQLRARVGGGGRARSLCRRWAGREQQDRQHREGDQGCVMPSAGVTHRGRETRSPRRSIAVRHPRRGQPGTRSRPGSRHDGGPRSAGRRPMHVTCSSRGARAPTPRPVLDPPS